MALTSGQKELERRAAVKPFHIEDMSVCYNCKTTDLKEEDKFCPNCRFPQRGTPKSKNRFIAI